MALTPQDAAKLAQQLKEIERLSKLLGANINTINLKPIEADAGTIEALFERLNDQFKQSNSEVEYLISGFQSLVGEIKKSNIGVNETTKTFRSLSSISQDLASHQAGFNVLSAKELATLKDKARIETSRLTRLQEVLKEEERELNILSQRDPLDKKIQKSLDENLASQNAISNLYSNNNVILTELNKKLTDSADEAKILEKRLGIVGGVLKGISKIPILGDLVDTERALKAMKEAGGGVAGLKAGIKNMGSQFMESVTNPANIALFVITQIGEALKGADKGAGDLAKGFNMTYNEAMGVREELTQMGNLSGDVALNTRALQESMMAVGQALGSNAMLNEKDLKTFTKLREQAGFTNDELLGIQKTTLATGGNLEKNAKNILYSAKLTGLNNKVLLNEKDIMRDVAKASDAIKLSLGGSGKKLGEAAAQAKSLGMSLSQVDKIAGSLLDFESSITNELSAELITGKQLNLEQARLYALNNDTAGVAREIAKNFGSAAEFSKMNRISQESIAKAVGMSREELATTLTDQAALKGLSGDKLKDAQAALDYARAQGMTEEQIAQQGVDNLMKQQSVQDRLNQSVEKLKEIFVSIAEPILKILSPLMDLLNVVLPGLNFAFQVILTPITLLSEGIGAIVGLLNGGEVSLKSMGKLALGLVGTFGIYRAIMLGITAQKAFQGSLDARAIIVGKSKVAQAVAETVAAAIRNPFLALAGLAVAGVVGAAIYSSMKDGVIDPSKGPVVSGGFGSVQLSDKDTAVFNGKQIVAGTNLGGGKSNSTPQQQDNSALIAEIRAMRQEQARSNSKPTVIENSVNGTRFGTAVAMNTYKTA